MNLPGLIAEAVLSARADAIVAADSDGVICVLRPGSRSQRHWEGYRKVMQTGQSRYGESDLLAVPALRKDGAAISVEFTILPL